jgi:hypothetical protein
VRFLVAGLEWEAILDDEERVGLARLRAKLVITTLRCQSED